MSMTIATIIWGISCLIAAVGCVLIFRAEDRRTIAELRRTVFALTRNLRDEHELTTQLRARLSQLQPVPELDQIIDRVTAHERRRTDEVYDQTKDRGPTQRIRTW